MCNVHIETNFSHVQIAGLLKKPWRRGSANSPGSLLVSSPLPPWRGATPRELSSRPGQGVGVRGDWRSRGRSQTNSTAASGKRWGWGGGRESRWSPLVIFLMLYCEAENIFIWSQGIWLTCSWRFCVVFEWPWNNSVSFSISKAPVSKKGMVNSFDLTLHTGFLSMNILVYISRVENCSALSQICSSSLEWLSLPHYKFYVILLW